MAEKAGGSRASGGRQSRAQGRRKAGDDPGEHLAGTSWKTALIDGESFRAKPVQYLVVDGLAIFEGDIVLGTAKEVERRVGRSSGEMHGRDARPRSSSPGASSAGRTARCPSTIDAASRTRRASPTRSRTGRRTRSFRFIAAHRPNAELSRLRDLPARGRLLLAVGKQGGQQFVNLGDRLHDRQRDPRDRPRGRALARAEPRGPRHVRDHQLGEYRGRAWSTTSTSTSPTATTSAPTTTARSCTTRATRSRATARDTITPGRPQRADRPAHRL